MVRQAIPMPLAGSYNFAAIHVIEKTGIKNVLEKLQTAYVAPSNRSAEDYGPRLALGAPKVRLLDLAAAFRFLVHHGRIKKPQAILSHHPYLEKQRDVVGAPSVELFTPEASWLTMHMLANSEARRAIFGEDLAVDLSYPIVAKTGTAQGFADTVAILASREWITAAWAGRFDGSPIKGKPAMTAAAPLARNALLLASQRRAWSLPTRPKSLERAHICSSSGERPGPYCPQQSLGWFQHNTIPTKTCSWHQNDGIHYPHKLQGWLRRHQAGFDR